MNEYTMFHNKSLRYQDLLSAELVPTATVSARFEREYARLQALPRKKQRKLQRTWKMTLTGIALALALNVGLLRPMPVRAATITVDAGGVCTLDDAITSANSDTATDGCVAGSGADTIDLQTDVSLTTALPNITSEITIDGNDHTIERDSGAGNFTVLKTNSSGNLTLNEATISGGTRGAIRNEGGTVTINDSTISGNSMEGFGAAGVYNHSGTLTINDSTISGNVHTGNGGGGGGVTNYYTGATATINNSTITGNTAQGGPGGIYNYYDDAALTLNGSLVTGNTGSSVNEVYNAATITANNYNLFGDSSQTNANAFDGFTPGVNDITATSDGTDPTALSGIIAALADNQGGTWTHALVTGSPAIDAIADGNANCDAGTSADQRGAVRAGGVATEGGTACDIGAYEYDSNETPTAITLTNLVARGGTWLMGLALTLGGSFALRRRRK